MGVQISLINGVNKIKLSEQEIRYTFPRANAYANNQAANGSGGVVEITPIDDGRGKMSFRFADLDENYGTSNAEGFLDYMAGAGFYQNQGTTQETTPAPADYSTLSGMKLPFINFVTDTTDTNTGTASFQLADAELESGDITESYTFTVASGDNTGFKVKQVIVGDNPTDDNLVADIRMIADATKADLLMSSSGEVVRSRMKGYDLAGNWLHPERIVIGIANDNQPELFGNVGVTGYDDRRYYTPIYLEPNRMVGTGCAWIQQIDMPDELADGLGSGTPDEFAVGGNVAQGKRGLSTPIFPEGENSPYFFEYLTKNAANNYALQARWQEWDGSTKSTGWQIYKQVDRDKAYLRVMFILGRSGATNYNKGTGYWYCLDLSDASTNNLINNIASIDVASIPDADYIRENIHIDEYIAVDEDGAATEDYEIMGPVNPNWYWDAYQSGSGRTQQLSTKNGDVMPELTVYRHPAFAWFIFQNDADYTTEDPNLNYKEFFRMLVKKLKEQL